MAIRLADTARPNNYIDAEHLGTYPVAYAEDVWFEDSTRLSKKTFGGIIDVETLPTSNIKNTFYRISNEIYLDYTSSVNKTYAEITADTTKITNVLDRAGINYSVDTHEELTNNRITINDSNELFLDIEKLVSDMYPSQPDKYSQYIGHYIRSIIIKSDQLEINFDNSPSSTNYSVFSEKYNFRLFIASMPDERIFMGDEKNNKVKELYNINIFTGTQAEWDALTVEQKKTYDQVNITDDDGGANLDYYSTEETKTNKRWIDGKPIYRRVFVNNSYSLTSDDWNNLSSIFSNYSSAEIDEVINANVFSVSNVLNERCIVAAAYITKNQVYIPAVVSLKSSSKVELVIEYTKTTD